MTILDLEKKLIETDNINIFEGLESIDSSSKDGSGNNILHYFIKNRKYIKIPVNEFFKMLDTLEFNYNEKQSKGQKRSPLALSILFNEKDIFKALLDRNVDIDNADVNGNTPLVNAIMEYRGDEYFVTNLLCYNADPNKANNYNISPFKLAHTIANSDVRKYFTMQL